MKTTVLLAVVASVGALPMHMVPHKAAFVEVANPLGDKGGGKMYRETNKQPTYKSGGAGSIYIDNSDAGLVGAGHWDFDSKHKSNTFYKNDLALVGTATEIITFLTGCKYPGIANRDSDEIYAQIYVYKPAADMVTVLDPMKTAINDIGTQLIGFMPAADAVANFMGTVGGHPKFPELTSFLCTKIAALKKTSAAKADAKRKAMQVYVRLMPRNKELIDVPAADKKKVITIGPLAKGKCPKEAALGCEIVAGEVYPTEELAAVLQATFVQAGLMDPPK